MSFDFREPERHLARADGPTAAAMVSAASDLTLVVDDRDVIADLSHNLEGQSGASLHRWRGRQIDAVVREDSRQAMSNALRMAREGQGVRRFDVSHVLEGGGDLPVHYAALGLGGGSAVILMGRDLRLVSDLQTRLLANRQSMERTTRVQKQAEAQYRLLFETASDAIIMVDAATGRIREANPRAAAILGIDTSRAGGRKLAALFGKASQADVKSLLSQVLASGAPARRRIARNGHAPIDLAAELFRAGDLNLTMIRLGTTPPEGGSTAAATGQGIESLVREAAEAIVITDDDGRVVWANESFLTLASAPLAAQTVGRPFGDFLGWSHAERDVVFDTVRRHGRVPTFAGTVRGADGQTTEVDLSGVRLQGGQGAGFGFVMRVRDAESAGHGAANSDVARTAERLAEMIGRVPMKDLVRDTTDVIERMCIEAALKLTGNNRASTARVLGLSRQALYLKMNRFGIVDGEDDGD